MLILALRPGRVLGWAISADGIVAQAGAVKYIRPKRRIMPTDLLAREPLLKYGLIPHLISSVMNRLPDAVVFQDAPPGHVFPLAALMVQHISRSFHLRGVSVYHLGQHRVHKWALGLKWPTDEQVLTVARLWATRELAQRVRVRSCGEAILTACYLAENGMPTKWLRHRTSRFSIRHPQWVYQPRSKYHAYWFRDSLQEINLL